MFSWQELEDMGYKMAIDSASVILTVVEAVRNTMTTYMQTGRPPASIAGNIELRTYIETLIGLEEYYEIEEKTLGLGKHGIK